MTQARTVAAYDAPQAPQVTIERLTGSGPRRAGDRYRATVTDAGEIGDVLGRHLTATYGGRSGGMDVWTVDSDRPWPVSGDLAFVTVQYGNAPVTA